MILDDLTTSVYDLWIRLFSPRDDEQCASLVECRAAPFIGETCM